MSDTERRPEHAQSIRALYNAAIDHLAGAALMLELLRNRLLEEHVIEEREEGER